MDYNHKKIIISGLDGKKKIETKKKGRQSNFIIELCAFELLLKKRKSFPFFRIFQGLL